MGDEPENDPFVIPTFLKRDGNNQAEYMFMTDSTVEVVTEHRPATAKPKTVKANGAAKAPIKATGKLKAKAAPKAPAKVKAAPKPAVKASKGSEKPKAAKRAEAMPKDAFGFRKGSSKSEAAAMYARKSGATLDEVKEKVGSVQLNCLVTLEATGNYEVTRKKEEREGQRPVTRYWLKAKA